MEFRIGQLNVPIWIIIGFEWKDRQYSQNLNIDTFLGCLLLMLSVLLELKKTLMLAY